MKKQYKVFEIKDNVSTHDNFDGVDNFHSILLETDVLPFENEYEAMLYVNTYLYNTIGVQLVILPIYTSV